ncbi:MAG: D-xylulose kinase [Frankiales bacterium]|nr:D-xylulose kinase [Frankiales bacterium]
MTIVAGVDSSTQSTKVALYDAADGTLVSAGTAAHPEGTAVDPRAWLRALDVAGTGLLDNAAAIGIGGQQHGMVLLDGDGAPVHDALLWNDTRSAGAAAALVGELGGPDAWAAAVGSVPVASFTVTKLRWVAEHAPEAAARATSVLLPHDWLTWHLTGRREEPVTDRGDASGTGYWSPAAGAYRDDIVWLAFGRELALPRVLAAGASAGETTTGAVVSAGTGDNMAAALGLGLRAGDAVVSIGTSGTVFAVSEAPTTDPSGIVAGFADATGRFLPLVCTLNAARVLSSTAAMLGVTLAELDALALAAPAGADGLTFVPYLDGERTPNVPDASGSLVGVTRANFTAATVARAAVEGMLCALADGLDAMRAIGVPVRRAFLVGGGAKSLAVQRIAADILCVPIAIPAPDEYVARGAARQSAWALSGAPQPPDWPVDVAITAEPGGGAESVRERYAEARSMWVPRRS